MPWSSGRKGVVRRRPRHSCTDRTRWVKSFCCYTTRFRRTSYETCCTGSHSSCSSDCDSGSGSLCKNVAAG